MVKDTPRSTNHFSLLAECTIGSTMDMMETYQSPKQEDKVVPHSSPLPQHTPTPRIYIRSANLRRSTELKIQVQTVDSSHPMAVDALLDSGATGMFIDVEFAKAKNLTTRQLPRPIPIYNIDGTLNESGSDREEVDLIMRYGDHSERSTFAVTSLGRVPIIVGHTWLVQHNPEIDWTTGEVTMSRCPNECGIKKLQANRTQRIRRRSQKTPTVPHPSNTLTSKRELPTILSHDNLPNSPASPHLSHGVPQREARRGESPGDDCEDRIKESMDSVEDSIKEGDCIFVTFIHPEQQIRATSSISTRLAIEEQGRTYKKRTFEDMVPKAYQDYRDVFAKESFDRLPPKRPWDHAIELKTDIGSSGTKLYPLSDDEQEAMDAFLTEHLQSGRIRPSKSPISAPVFFVKKKDGGLRFVQDYRKLNTATIKNVYPLPLVSDILNKVARAKIFTKLDVRWGYNNIRLRAGDEWKAAFRTNRELFEPVVMFFGLTNSPATFQTMMNHLFKELIDEGVVAVYMDDILIFTETLVQHQQVVRRVLQILRENNLFLKAEKCIFEQSTVEYLGLILSPGQVAMDPVKVAGVRDWPVPTTVKEVQSFLGFVNFYRHFIQDFSHVARPLHNLTRKDEPWKWTDDQQKAFEQLKDAITSTPILMHPDRDKPFHLEADSSNFATGAVLSQLHDDGKWHPIGFISKSLNEAERNYEIYDKELLAIVRGLQEFRHLLEGAHHQVEILTNHRNLEYFMTAQSLNCRQARWSLFLSRFDIHITSTW